MERKAINVCKEDLENIFSKTMGDFTRITINEIKDVNVDSTQDYENIQDVVIYANTDCSICCGILIEQFNGKLQLTLTRFDGLVLLDEVAPVISVAQLNESEWGYEGFNDIAMVEDVNNLKDAKKLLEKFLLTHSK